VYCPPAYFADNSEPPPGLVLTAGQPGDPRDWLAGDRLQSLMGGFAAHHSGLAPVVVVPDALGAQQANLICVDSSLGRVARPGDSVVTTTPITATSPTCPSRSA